MRRPSSFVVRLAIFAVASLALACGALPTAPAVTNPHVVANRDGGSVPCDSTVVTDGSCVGGWIIPW